MQKEKGSEHTTKRSDGKKIFVIDGHAHLWDARPENRVNRHGFTFIETFWKIGRAHV